MAEQKKKKLDKKSLEELRTWVEEQEGKDTVPESILSILLLMLSFFSVGSQSKKKRDVVYELWKMLWGLSSKSETRSSKDKPPKGKNSNKEESDNEKKSRLEKQKEKRKQEIEAARKNFHVLLDTFYDKGDEVRGKLNKSARKEGKGRPESWKELKEEIGELGFGENLWCMWKLFQIRKRKNLTSDMLDSYANRWNYAIDNVEPFDISSQDFGSFQVESPNESLFGSLPFTTLPPKKHRIPLGEAPNPDSPVRSRVVRELSISYQEIEIEVEHRTDSEGNKTYGKDLLPIAPPRIQYTFQSIINIMMLVISFGIPISRLSTMLKGFPSGFSSSTIWDLLHYAAERLCPIYIQLARDLNHCKRLHGDDTVPRVLELKEEDDDLSEARGVRKEVESFFPLVSKTKSGYWKEKILTSFLSGVTEENREASRILFYRTHRGSLGNLLNFVFNLRKPASKDTPEPTSDSVGTPMPCSKKENTSNSPPKYATCISLTSDLSKENLPSEEILKEHGIEFEVTGCLAHARRGIFRNRDADPDHCDTILQCFEDIYSVEQYVKEEFNNRLNARAEMRSRLSYRFWGLIVEEARVLSEKWPDSEIKKAADYIIGNAVFIAKFLTNPELTVDNNFSERNVRPEKMFKNNRLFSRTIHGRVMLDIMLSVIRTAVASCESPEEYLMWVFQSDPKQVAENPQMFTPFAFVQKKNKVSG